MDAMRAILTRRSIGKVSDERPPREVIESLLEAATHAPNHYKVEPWRFVVLAGEARKELGALMADILAEEEADELGRLSETARKIRLETEANKALRAPVLIAVIAQQGGDPRVIEIENVCAAAAATQNILLAAHAQGLAAQWRTGPAAYDARVKEFLGAQPEEHIVAFVYVGYAAEEPAPYERKPAAEKTTWRGWS